MTASTQIVQPARSFQGSLVLPGDASVSHNYALLAGLAEGVTRLSNFAAGAASRSLLESVRALGATVDTSSKDYIAITGTGGSLRAVDAPLDGGSSEIMHMLAGLVAAHPNRYTLRGDAALDGLQEPFTRMGAAVELRHAPITIRGGPLQAIDFDMPRPSAPIKAAVLFAAIQAEGTTSLREAVRTHDHSEHALRAFGASLSRKGDRILVAGGQRLRAIEATVPGDLSLAAYFLCAALLFPDSNLVLDVIGMNPARSVLLDVLVSMGGSVKVLAVEEHHGELVGSIKVNRGAGALKGIDIAGPLSMQLQDALPALAAIAPYTREGIRIHDAKGLDGIARNLRAMGTELTEHEDGLEIPGGQSLHGGVIDSGGDPRIAMAFSIAALAASSESEIHGADAAATLFPEFFHCVEMLAQR
ncbi:MAG TPA: 3-phosphoshikimate 1-carboxyvinyltransferase [Granulicella sp.]